MLVAAAVKTGRPELGHRILELVDICLYRDQWLEYYDGKHGRLIGKEARSIKPGRSLLSSGKGINSKS